MSWFTASHYCHPPPLLLAEPSTLSSGPSAGSGGMAHSHCTRTSLSSRPGLWALWCLREHNAACTRISLELQSDPFLREHGGAPDSQTDCRLEHRALPLCHPVLASLHMQQRAQCYNGREGTKTLTTQKGLLGFLSVFLP